MEKFIPLIKSLKTIFYLKKFELREIAFEAIQIRCSIEIKFQILIPCRTHLLALSLSLSTAGSHVSAGPTRQHPRLPFSLPGQITVTSTARLVAAA
jgi:hypothetical protein